jgi:hypothetical protein
MELTTKRGKKYQLFIKNTNVYDTSHIDFLETTDKGTAQNSLEQALNGLPDCILSKFSFVASKMKIRYTDITVEPKILKSDDYSSITKVEFILSIKSEAPREIISYCFQEVLKTCPAGILCEKYSIAMDFKIIIL